MRFEEYYAAQKTREFLEKQGQRVEVLDGEDPPDFVFRVDGKTWAVEHTQLYQYVNRDGEEQSRGEIDAINARIGNKIREKTEGGRKSSWLLALYGPREKEVGNEIIRLARESITSEDLTAFEPIPDNHAYLRNIPDNQGRFTFFSMVPPTSVVPSSRNISADIQSTVNYAIERILANKVHVLRRLEGYHKRTLVILSQYMLASHENVSRAFDLLRGSTTGVDTVYLVLGEETFEIVIRNSPQ